MRIVWFVDLDDTLFQTLHKCPDGEAVYPVAYRRDGAPLSYMTERQRLLVEELFASATVIPATARNADAFRRVQLPFRDFAILDFGGVILRGDGALDEEWDARIRPQALHIAGELRDWQEAAQRFNARGNLELNVRLVSDFDMALYLVAKHPQGQGERLRPLYDELAAAIDSERYFLHLNDNNLSLAPRFLGKEHAVRHLMERRLGPAPFLSVGLGDSLTDASFMELCDFSFVPRASQLARRLFTAQDP